MVAYTVVLLDLLESCLRKELDTGVSGEYKTTYTRLQVFQRVLQWSEPTIDQWVPCGTLWDYYTTEGIELVLRLSVVFHR